MTDEEAAEVRVGDLVVLGSGDLPPSLSVRWLPYVGSTASITSLGTWNGTPSIRVAGEAGEWVWLLRHCHVVIDRDELRAELEALAETAR